MQHYRLVTTTTAAPEGTARNCFDDQIFYETSFTNHETNQQNQQNREALEAAALAHLERARAKPVAFAVRSNVKYDSSLADQSPLYSSTISFSAHDFLHIMEKYNDNWWIGRPVKEGCDIGFLPSPMKLESLRTQHVNQYHYLEDELGQDEGAHIHIGDVCERSGAKTALALGNVLLNKDKRKLFKKFQHPSPYEVIPTIRPVILIGPSLKGFEVTDMMQKAIFDFLKERFKNRIIITRVTADISLAKQVEQTKSIVSGSGAGVGIGSRRQGLIDRSNNSRLSSNLAEVTYEIERVFELARTMQLVVLDCDTINHPEQVAKCSLAPILVYLKVASPKVLQRLIKSRGRGQARQINAQMSAAEKLNQLPNDAFDVVLDENQLDEACNHLANYLKNYWRAIHLPGTYSTNGTQTKEVPSNRVLRTQSTISAAPVSHNHHYQHQTSLPNRLSTPQGQAFVPPPEMSHNFDFDNVY